MRKRLGGGLLVTLVLAACQLPPGKASSRLVTAVQPSQAATTLDAAGTAPAHPASPKPVATDKASTGVAPVSVLQRPVAASETLAGTIAIDPAYATGAGGTLQHTAGGDILVVGGGSLGTADTALVGTHILTSSSGNVIPAVADGFLPTTGGTAGAAADGSLLASGDGLVSNNGGGIIGNNGGGLVSNNGGGVLSNNGAGFHVLADATPGVGSALPCAGMLVSAISLRTHAYMPVGQDAQGKPVYVVYSGAHGEYNLYLSPAEGTVLVVANPPHARQGRSFYSVLTPNQATTTASMDEDTLLATRLVRTSLAGHIVKMLVAATPADASADITQGVDPNGSTTKALIQVAQKVYQRARSGGLPVGDAAADIPDVRDLALTLTDVVLGYIDYDSLQDSKLFSPTWQGTPEQVYEALGHILATARTDTQAYMNKQLAAGGSLPVLIHPWVMHDLGTPDVCFFSDTVALSSPSDLGNYLVSDFLSRTKVGYEYNVRSTFLATALINPGYSDDPDTLADPDVYQDAGNGLLLRQDLRVNACINTLLASFVLALGGAGTDGTDSPALTAALAIADTFIATHHFAGPPQPVPRIGTGAYCTTPEAATGAASVPVL